MWPQESQDDSAGKLQQEKSSKGVEIEPVGKEQQKESGKRIGRKESAEKRSALNAVGCKEVLDELVEMEKIQQDCSWEQSAGNNQ